MDHVEFVCAPFRIVGCEEKLPGLYDSYRQHAVLVEEFELASEDGVLSFFGVGRSNDWPELVVSQRYSPAGYGFNPGILLVRETETVFIGAGERLLAYSVGDPPRRLWVDRADAGFWSWNQHGSIVLMSAELQLAAWTSSGVKLWSKFVEPPWTYSVAGDLLVVDVMGQKSSFHLADGHQAE